MNLISYPQNILTKMSLNKMCNSTMTCEVKKKLWKRRLLLIKKRLRNIQKESENYI